MSEVVVNQRRWVAGRPVDVVATWGPLHRGGGDPTWRMRAGTLWRGVRTPGGPVTLAVSVNRDQEAVSARAWGTSDGVEWTLDALPDMLGARDHLEGFDASHPLLRQALKAHPGWRVPRTGLVMESLVPAIIEQKVTGQEAFAGFRQLVLHWGTVAPGPGADLGLRVQPDVAAMRAIPSWEWLELGISPNRADTIAGVLSRAARLAETADLELPQARRRLMAVPGIGVWTAAETAQRALGDADAVSFGDYHVAKNIGWALTGREVDDQGLVEVLAPYAPHRYRVQRLLALAGLQRPRHGARMSPRGHIPIRRSRR